MCSEVRGLSIAMMDELAEEVQFRFPGEKVNAPLLITIYYAARLDHAKRLLAATNDIENRELVNYLVNLAELIFLIANAIPITLISYSNHPFEYIVNALALCYEIMSRPGNARCKCCDEVMEELLTMRQTFEKLFHKLTKQVVELARQVAANGSGKKNKTKRDSSASPSRCSPPPTKSKRFNNNSESETECYKLKTEKKSTAKKSVMTKQEPVDPVDPVDVHNVTKVSRPVLDFFNIQARVMPTQPFKTADQFEDWNDIFKSDEDQCDQLRVELLQGHFDEPDKYIKHIWRSIFKNEAAQCYSYRGNGRCKKRAIKGYIFTDIFRECFLQRFHHMDATFFMERTMRFFNYAHDQKRKTIRNAKKHAKNADGTQNEDPIDHDITQDEQSYNGYEGSMLL